MSRCQGNGVSAQIWDYVFGEQEHAANIKML